MAGAEAETEAEGEGSRSLSLAGRGLREAPAGLSPALLALDLSDNPLRELRGLGRCPALTDLVLDGCGLTDAALRGLPRLPALRALSLNKNQLRDAEAALSLLAAAAPALRLLSLLGNPACPHPLNGAAAGADEADYERFRCYALSWLPALSFLDCRAVGGRERALARTRGRLMRLARPAAPEQPPGPGGGPAEGSGSPLPAAARPAGDHRAAYGRCRFRYSGRQSEGNRFIGNGDL